MYMLENMQNSQIMQNMQNMQKMQKMQKMQDMRLGPFFGPSGQFLTIFVRFLP